MKKHALKFAIVAIALIAVSSCTKADDYEMGRAELGMNFMAKNMCNCLWVAGLSESHCRDHVRIEKVNPNIEVLSAAREVKVSLFWIYKARARFVSERAGCQPH
jgi:hypothetical protein